MERAENDKENQSQRGMKYGAESLPGETKQGWETQEADLARKGRQDLGR